MRKKPVNKSNAIRKGRTKRLSYIKLSGTILGKKFSSGESSRNLISAVTV